MRELSERCLHMDHSLSHHGTRPRSSDRREAAGPMGLAVDRVIQARMELVSPGILHSKGGGYLFRGDTWGPEGGGILSWGGTLYGSHTK